MRATSMRRATHGSPRMSVLTLGVEDAEGAAAGVGGEAEPVGSACVACAAGPVGPEGSVGAVSVMWSILARSERIE